jgi:hypothetical protein
MHLTALAWVMTVALVGGLLTLDWILLGRHTRAGLGEAGRWPLFYIRCPWQDRAVLARAYAGAL